MNAEPMFEFYIGIDYSGAETAKSGLRALRIYTADPNTPPQKSSCLAADGHVVQLPSGCKLNCPEIAERWWV